MEPEAWLLVAAVLVALVAVGLSVVVVRQQRALRATLAEDARQRAADAAADPGPPPPSGPLLAFVANPSKSGADALRPALVARCAAENLPEPLWIETSVEDPGVGQTREALDKGADVVVAVGGDGTVRAVAEGMVGTGKPMALLPLGTGNLLARNLDISVTDVEAAFDVALTGMDRTIDVGWLEVDAPAPALPPLDKHGVEIPEDGDQVPLEGTPVDKAPAEVTKHIFLVIAGLGFDAAMVADADANLKAKMGWMAYFVAGVKHLHGRRMQISVALDDKDFVAMKVRSVMVGNCGRLPGGITLIPDAVIDDGVHDVAVIDTRGGVAGWAQLLGEVTMQRFGMSNDLPNKIGRIDHTRAERVRLRVEAGEQVQVDGDVLGRAIECHTWVEPSALVVRAPIPKLSAK